MLEPFEVSVSRRHGEITILVSGELDIAAEPQLQPILDRAIREAEWGLRVVLDLQALTFCDSTGLRLLVTAQRLAAKRSVQFGIVPPTGAAWAAVEICGLQDVLPFVPSAGDRHLHAVPDETDMPEAGLGVGAA